jgi:hypothetical protein
MPGMLVPIAIMLVIPITLAWPGDDAGRCQSDQAEQHAPSCDTQLVFHLTLPVTASFRLTQITRRETSFMREFAGAGFLQG